MKPIACSAFVYADNLLFWPKYLQSTEDYAPCCGPQRWNTVIGTDCPANPSFCTVDNSCYRPGTYDQTNHPDYDGPSELIDSSNAAANPGMFCGGTTWCCKFSDVKDGLANTIMICERTGNWSFGGGAFGLMPACPTWMKINSPLRQNPQFFAAGTGQYQLNAGGASYHPGGANFCLGDGSVQFLSDSIDFELYNALGGRADGINASVP